MYVDLLTFFFNEMSYISQFNLKFVCCGVNIQDKKQKGSFRDLLEARFIQILTSQIISREVREGRTLQTVYIWW